MTDESAPPKDTEAGLATELPTAYSILMLVIISVWCYPVTGVAVVLIGAGIGALGSPSTPFATVIAKQWDARRSRFLRGQDELAILRGRRGARVVR